MQDARSFDHLKLSSFLLSLLFALASTGCNPADQQNKRSSQSNAKSNRVVAVSYALQYFTQRIVGETVEVVLPVPATVDPKSWKPSVADIKSLQTADLVVTNGERASYAKWLQQVTLNESKLCRSTSYFSVENFANIRDYQIIHTHGPSGEHSHPFSVPYCWLDPSLAKKQAAKIAESLTATYPKLAETIDTNLSELNTELDKLIEEYSEAKLPFESTFSANPLTYCFTRAIGVKDHYLYLFEATNLIDLDKSTEKLTALLAEHAPQTMLVSSTARNEFAEFFEKNLPSSTQIIAIDLLDHAPDEGDYLTVMRKNLKAVTTAKSLSKR